MRHLTSAILTTILLRAGVVCARHGRFLQATWQPIGGRPPGGGGGKGTTLSAVGNRPPTANACTRPAAAGNRLCLNAPRVNLLLVAIGQQHWHTVFVALAFSGCTVSADRNAPGGCNAAWLHSQPCILAIYYLSFCAVRVCSRDLLRCSSEE